MVHSEILKYWMNLIGFMLHVVSCSSNWIIHGHRKSGSTEIIYLTLFSTKFLYFTPGKIRENLVDLRFLCLFIDNYYYLNFYDGKLSHLNSEFFPDWRIKECIITASLHYKWSLEMQFPIPGIMLASKGFLVASDLIKRVAVTHYNSLP